MGDADEEIPKDRSKGKDSMTPLEQQVDEIVAASLASKGCLLDAEGMVEIGPPNDGSAAPRRKAHKRNKGPGGSASRSGLGGGASRSRATQGGSVATSTSSKESNRIGTSRSSVGGGLSSAHSAGGQTSSSDAWADAKEGRDVMVARESARVLSSRALLLSLRTVERAIQQNSYHSRHRLYRCVWEFFAQQMSLAVGLTHTPHGFSPTHSAVPGTEAELEARTGGGPQNAAAVVDLSEVLLAAAATKDGECLSWRRKMFLSCVFACSLYRVSRRSCVAQPSPRRGWSGCGPTIAPSQRAATCPAWCGTRPTRTCWRSPTASLTLQTSAMASSRSGP